MSELAEFTQAYLDAFAQWQRDNTAAATLTPLRERALAQFAEQGFPSTRVEQWKYTNLRPIAKRAFAVSDTGATIDALPGPDLDGPVLVFVDGMYRPALSSIHGLAKGMAVRPTSELLDNPPEVLNTALERDSEAPATPLAALNAAFTAQGAHIEIAPNADAELPIRLLFVNSEDSAVAAYPRITVDAGANSRLTLIEQHTGLGKAGNFTNLVCDIRLADGAQLSHYRLHEGGKLFHVGLTRVSQARDSRYRNTTLNLGGQLVRNDLQVGLNAPGAECELDGLYNADKKQHVDNHLIADHAAPNTTSHQYYRGILDGHARAVFNGKVIVREGADGADAQQSNKNLLLSKNAEADTKPELEIYADEVTCSHGATVGQLDDQAMFYLRSRGIEESMARGLLIYAFGAEVLERLPLDALRRHGEAAIAGRLPELDRVRGVA